MAKFVPNEALDRMFDYISGCANMLVVCAGSPTTYTDVTGLHPDSGSMLAMIGMTSGCFATSDDTSGRKLDVTAKTGASIVSAGSALAVALVSTTNASVCYITTCTEQYLTAGGTVDVPTWKINIQDPT